MRMRRRGVAILFVASMSMVILPTAGLAIDAGVLFVLQERLSAAVDAAAAAAGRASTPEAAHDAARRFFEANFPAGYLGSSSHRDLRIEQKEGRTLITATIQAPVYLLRLVRAEGPMLTSQAVSTPLN